VIINFRECSGPRCASTGLSALPHDQEGNQNASVFMMVLRPEEYMEATIARDIIRTS
jgi:hypothetical protein